jgi:hypothetical protein
MVIVTGTARHSAVAVSADTTQPGQHLVDGGGHSGIAFREERLALDIGLAICWQCATWAAYEIRVRSI